MKCPMRFGLNGQRPERFCFNDHSYMRFVQKMAHVLPPIPPMLDVELVKIRRFMVGFPMGFERRSTRPGQTDRTNIM